MTAEGSANTDAPISSALGQELQAATYPQTVSGLFLQARDKHGAWSPEARVALAGELRRAQALDGGDAEGDALIEGVIAALEDRR